MNKKKRIRIITGIALLLIALAAILLFSKRFSTIKEDLSDFAIEDTASVTKIFLADKQGNKSIIERKGPGTWVVNYEHEARQEAVNLLLQTIKKMEVKNPVARAARESVLKHMSANATKVEVFNDEGLIKTIYVGGATSDQLGTYMLIEGSDSPFVMHVPGHNGYLSPRFFTRERLWRNRIIFANPPETIKTLTVIYPDSAEISYSIDVPALTVKSMLGSPVPVKDTMKVMSYLKGFTNIQFESLAETLEEKRRDSIIASNPFAVITLVDTSSKSQVVKLFRMPVNSRTVMPTDSAGRPRPYDPDKFYAYLDNKDLTVVQYFVFDRLLSRYNRFAPNQAF